MPLKEKILKEVFDFYKKSRHFNGIPLSTLSKKVGINYQEIIPIIEALIKENCVSIQSGLNPHVIRVLHHNVEIQLEELKKAANNKIEIETIIPQGFKEPINPIEIAYESFLVCAYPSKAYLKKNFSKNKYKTEPFTRRLALGEAQLTAVFFEMEVIDRYFTDPRYLFRFRDYSGNIYANDIPTLKEHDDVFIKSFGLGYGNDDNRVIVVYLCYLSNLSPEHQMYWYSKIATPPCKILEEYYVNTIVGDWTTSTSFFSAFIEEHRLIMELSKLINREPLFRETFEEEKTPREFTFFTSPTLKNYEDFVSLLDKMISENINKDFFKGDIEEFEFIPIKGDKIEKRTKGTLKLLDEWLRKHYKIKDEKGYQVLMQPLYDLRKERQKPAHKISKNYYDKDFHKKQMDLLEKVYSSFTILRNIFKTHPRAKDFEIPKWVEEGNIKRF